MTIDQAQKRIQQLKEVINYHRYQYHVLDRQEISDSVLDSLKKELFDLEEQFPDLITQDSPTQRIGGKPLKTFHKVKHIQPMTSFNDSFSEEDMRNWFKRAQNFLGTPLLPSKSDDSLFYCELKIDGLAIELVYQDNVFVQGSTRGNGLIGEDVTQNLKTIDAIPLKILPLDEIKKNLKAFGLTPENYNLTQKQLVVRGEVFLSLKEFNRINKEQEKKNEKIFANPRNIAAGSIRQLDPKITASRKLDTFQYSIVNNLGQTTHEEEHLLLKAFGFKTNPHNKPVKNLNEVFEFRNYWEKHREKLSYEVDGVVVIINKNSTFSELGIVGKAPRGATAYKFSPKEAATIVEDIKIQVGRTGKLTPVAVLKPVNIGGITITNASLHTYDQIKKLDLKIGDTAIISRAGDVIPQIIKVIKELRTGKEKDFQMPKLCPIDDSPVIQDGAYFKCSNPSCGARNREYLSYFVSKNAFDIRGMGEKIIDRFLDEGLISDAGDIFNLTQGDIEALERFGQKSAQNLIKEIEDRKQITLHRFIYSLGIFHVGEETARALAKIFSSKTHEISMSDFANFYKNLSLQDLQKIPDIGPQVSKSIVEWFNQKHNINLLNKFSTNGVVILPEAKPLTKQIFLEKIFVLTGALNSLTRDQAKEKIRNLGGEISETISAKTDYVVVGNDPGSKYAKATKLGVKILNEREFLNLIS